MDDDDGVVATGNMITAGSTAAGKIRLTMFVGDTRHVYEFHPIDAAMIARMIARKVVDLAAQVASN